MPRRFVGSRVFGASSGDRLFLEQSGKGQLTIFYQPSKKNLKESEEYADPKQHEKAKRTLLRVNRLKDLLQIYPLNTLPHHPDFLKPKYKRIESITLEGFDFEMPKSEEQVVDLLEELPSGFVKDYSFGLGLVKDYRFIINAIEDIREIKHLIISQRRETGISGTSYILNSGQFDSIRRGLNRITSRQQTEGAQDKRILAHNSLLTSLDPMKFPEKSRPYRKDTIFKLIGTGDKNSITLSPADQSAAIRLVEENKRDIAHKAPAQLLQLRKDIEIVALEVLITKVDEMLGKNLHESRWQNLLNENPFILNLAFGYPVIKIQDQAHVGGRRLSGSSDTIADFLVKNRISNNAALFEIKTPGTPLLNKTAYRGNLYTPSSDLSGAINQMLDQKNKFQKEIASLKENSRVYDLESYAVHGVLIIGTTPQGIEQQKSFELFRGNSKDITIITFDELLQKLKLLHSFLSDIPEARQASKLHRLETKAMQLQDGFHGLYEYGESKSGKLKMMTMKPFPGIDAKKVRAVGGGLSVLKHGFERVRLQKPPYPVAFDDSGNRAVKVASVDEFIFFAEKVLADAEAVLESQLAAKNDAREH